MRQGIFSFKLQIAVCKISNVLINLDRSSFTLKLVGNVIFTEAVLLLTVYLKYKFIPLKANFY